MMSPTFFGFVRNGDAPIKKINVEVSLRMYRFNFLFKLLSFSAYYFHILAL